MRLTFTQEADFRQRRDFGQKFSATFEFIAAHWRGLGRCLLLMVLPVMLISGILTGLIQSKFLLASGEAAKATRGRALDTFLGQMSAMNSVRQSPTYWLSVVVGGVLFTMMVLTVYGYLLNCLRPAPTGEPIGPRQVWAVVKQEFLSAYFSYFGLALLTIIGFFLLAIPGFYISVAFSLFFMVKLVEGRGFGANCSRCLSLIRGKWWSTFGLLLVMLMILGVVIAVLGGLLGGGMMLLGKQAGLTETSGSRELLVVTSTALGSLLNLLIYPPLLLAIAFQYFNLVERRDGTGLHQLVNQIGQAPVAVQNAALRADEEGEY